MAARLVMTILGISLPMVLARTLLQEDYGTFKQAWILSSTLFFVLPFGITQSLLFFVPRDSRNQRLYVSHVLLATWVVGLLSTAILWLGGGAIADLFDNRKLGALMPMVAVITGLRLCSASWDLVYLSEGRVGSAAILRAGFETFYTVCVVAAALLLQTTAGALAGILIAFVVRAVVSNFVLLSKFGFAFDRHLLVRQLRYALPFGLAFALMIPQQQFHFYAVAAAVPAATFAVYNVGCLQLPIIEMLYSPMSDVMQLAIAEEDGRGRPEAAIGLFRDTVSQLSFVFVPLLALLLVVAPALIRFFFTDRYAEAVSLFRITLLSIPLAALPLEGLMRARAQKRFMLVVSVSKFASTVILVLLGLHWFGMVGSIVGFMLAEEVGRGLMLWRATVVMRAKLADILPLRDLAVRAATSLVAAFAARVAMPGGAPALLQLASAGAVFALVYLAILGWLGGLSPLCNFLPRWKRVAEKPPPRAAA
jgi:O-antigen/teichoic acid export membrane protein